MANLTPVNSMACSVVLYNGQNAYSKTSSGSAFGYKLKNIHLLFIPLAF